MNSRRGGKGKIDGYDATFALIDYGAGNIRSVKGALNSVLDGGGFRASTNCRGARTGEGPRIAVCIVSTGNDLTGLGDALVGMVLPGVGSFSWAMDSLEERALDRALRERVESGIPLLGICLGMHLLFEAGTEGVEGAKLSDGDFGVAMGRGMGKGQNLGGGIGFREGLGLLKGVVRPLKEAPVLPHMGWDGVRWIKEAVLGRAHGDLDYFYFAHSYVPTNVKNEDVLAICSYGTPFAAVVRCGSVLGVQFHPEKSGQSGLWLLGSFVGYCLERLSQVKVRNAGHPIY